MKGDLSAKQMAIFAPQKRWSPESLGPQSREKPKRLHNPCHLRVAKGGEECSGKLLRIRKGC